MRRISIGKRAKRDSPLRKKITESWEKWLEGRPDEVSVPRSITHQKQEITGIDLHGFQRCQREGMQRSSLGRSPSREEETQGLVASKSRIAKLNVSIPRLERI